VAETAVAIVHYCSSDTGKKTLEKIGDKIGDKVPDLIDKLIPEPTKKVSDQSPQGATTYSQSTYNYSGYNHSGYNHSGYNQSAGWTAPRENNTDASGDSNKLMGNTANNFPLLEG